MTGINDSMICYNCDEDFSGVVDGDKYWCHCKICKEGFCSESCLEEHLALYKTDLRIYNESF